MYEHIYSYTRGSDIRPYGLLCLDQGRYSSICSAINCPLEITADNHFVISNGAVYDAIQAAYIVLRIMGY